MIKIYCENGALTKEIKALGLIDDIELIYFPFENFTRKAKRSNIPSELTWDNTFITFDDDKITFSNCDRSEIFEPIAKIIGLNNLHDISHVDTAYKERCLIFISPDKGDIISKASNLEQITGMKFFYCQDFESINNEIEKKRNKE